VQNTKQQIEKLNINGADALSLNILYFRPNGSQLPNIIPNQLMCKKGKSLGITVMLHPYSLKCCVYCTLLQF